MPMPGMPGMDMSHQSMALMPGMLTPEQMDALRKAKGAEFDRLFLTGMIQHHNGALIMVKDLFDTAGAGQDADSVRLRHRCGQHATRRDQNHASHVAERNLQRRNNESSAQSSFSRRGGRVCFIFRRCQPHVTRKRPHNRLRRRPGHRLQPAAGRRNREACGRRKSVCAAKPAPPLPPGMTGSDANDPRFKLTPGLYDAGEASMGIEAPPLLKKPDAFQLGSADPDDPKVQKTLAQLGVGNPAKMPKPLQLEIAQLAFANSDFAFQGNHLFQGNFYGVNIYDISNPANTQLLTSMVCPGGQGDVSVYKNLLFMSVEMPNGRLDCGTQGFPPNPPPEPGHEKEHRLPAAQKDRFRGVRIFDISDIKNPEASRRRADLPRFAHAHPGRSIRTTRTTFTSTSPAHPSCVSRKNSPAAPAKSRTRIPTPRCSASM